MMRAPYSGWLAIGACIALGVACLWLAGCDERQEPTSIRWHHPAGFDVIRAHRSVWEAEYPSHAVKYRRIESQAITAAASFGSGIAGWGTTNADAGYVSGVRACGHKRLNGAYMVATKEAWVFCDDPWSPTTEELWTEKHEIFHGVQEALGWSHSAALWAELPARHRTHPEFNALLKH